MFEIDQPLHSPATGDLRLAIIDAPELKEIGERLLASHPSDQITLRPLTARTSRKELRSQFLEGPIIACDFPVTDMHLDTSVTGGFFSEPDDLLNIDHHAPVARMFQHISSGTLAIEHILANGPTREGTHIVINHTDCDSVVSSLIIAGVLPPEPIFNRAVLAADHTGKPDSIADLLQALDRKRNIDFSTRELGRLLSGQDLDQDAHKLLQARMLGREETRAAIMDSDALLQDGALSVVRLSGSMRNEFMAAVLPDAMVILTTEPGNSPGTWVSRFRLGNAAPAGLTIFDLKINEFDPGYGGRWNAGSNKRGGGTSLPLAEYIQNAQIGLDAYLSSLSQTNSSV